MIIPDIHQLHCWCAAHDIIIDRRLTAYAANGDILVSIIINQDIELKRDALIDATEKIAKALCLVSPQRALNLCKK